MSSILLRGAENGDIRVSGGVVAEIARSARRLPGERVIECDGGVVLPGLCDHHLHLHALAAARSSIRCGPPAVRDPGGLAAALAAAVPDESGWIRGTGYFESVAGRLDAASLDRMRPDIPVRLQHRSGALWILNSAALRMVGARGEAHPGIERTEAAEPTGRLWRADDWLRGRLATAGGPRFPSLAAVGAELLGYGITAVTDATPDLDPAAIGHISDALRRGDLPPRVHLLGVPFGVSVPATPGLTVGPYKIVLADSGMLTYPELADRIAAARDAGRAVAVHCVTREAVVLLIAVLRDVGARDGDRIEHAGIVPADLIGDLAGLGVRVVTQPGFLADRGDDFLRELPEADQADLYRCATLLQAGVPVALSSDAPYGPLDPRTVISAALSRRTRSGQVASPAERLSLRASLGAYLAPPQDPGGMPRQVAVGPAADLVVLGVPLPELPLVAAPVRAVVIGERVVEPAGQNLAGN